MNNYASIYWLTRLDGINGLVIWIAILSIAFVFITTITCIISRDFDQFESETIVKARQANRERFSKKVPLFIFTGILFSIISILLPTEKQAIMIIAGGKTMNFIQTDTSISKIPSQTTAIISQFLDKQLHQIDSAKSK